MLAIKIVFLALIVSTVSRKVSFKHIRNEEELMEEKGAGGVVPSRTKYGRQPTTTGRSIKGEAVIEKFVETLMASEKYLKMVEVIEKKLTHLDSSFHERTKDLTKHMMEMMRLITNSPIDLVEKALKGLKDDLEKLRDVVTEMEKKHSMHGDEVEGHEYHGDGNMNTRLGYIENNMKNVMAGVDTILATIQEVKTRQISRTYKNDPVGSPGVKPVDAMALINEFRRTLLEQRTKKCECKTGRFDRSERYPTDCQEIQMQGFNVSGIYKVKPDDIDSFYVLCDLSTSGGGWTVFQNRFDGSQDFYKTWWDYKHGFGNLAGEFWLGLEKLHYLTNQKLYELRVEVETQHGQDAYASYSVFTVGPEHEGYRISTLGTYYGTAGDSLTYHAGQKFSSPDVDNDEWKEGSCATEHGGAWWYKECDKSNLNGKYLLTGDEQTRIQSIYWISYKGPNYPLAKTKMMIRPLPASRPNDYEQTRKHLDSPKVLKAQAEAAKPLRKDKGSYDMHGRSPYRYDTDAHADPFFSNYA